MANFNEAFQNTMLSEGGYTNNPKDKGGETYKGISRRRNPDWKGWTITDKCKPKRCFPKCLDKNIDLQHLVAELYRQKYWDSNHLTEFTNQNIAEKMFDIGVNMGIAVAAKMLQRALNVSNQNERYFKDLKEDGIIGVKTLESVNKHPYPEVIFKCLNVFQGMKYINLAERNQTQEAFINGWFMKRIAGISTSNE